MQERGGVGFGLEGSSTFNTPQHSALRSPLHQVLPPHQAPQLFIIPTPSYLDPLPKQDLNLREASRLLQEGLAATNVEQEERAWTAVIEKYKDVDAPWAADVVSEEERGGRRERGRRGRSKGGKEGKEERAWTAVIEKYKDVDAPWAADVVRRVKGGEARGGGIG